MITMHPRVHTLVTAFERIHRERMAGLPLLHPRLRVAAFGFEQVEADGEPALQGVLTTPWFMSLVHLPLAHQGLAEAVGRSTQRRFGVQRFDCLVGHEDGLGRYESCALFSPMQEFQDQPHAEQVAQEVLRALRAAPAPQAGEMRPANAPPSRRLFLFGRGAASGA